jgi:hypothetical protein
LGISMSQIAAAAGIGRATLYKYFPDVERVVAAWHNRQVADHWPGWPPSASSRGTARSGCATSSRRTGGSASNAGSTARM